MDPTWIAKHLSWRQMIIVPLLMALVFSGVLFFRWHTEGTPVPLSLDFKGGTIIRVRGIDNVPNADVVKDNIKNIILADIDVKVTEDRTRTTGVFGLDMETDKPISDNEKEQIKEALTKQFGNSIIIGMDWKGSIITGIFKEQAWKAIVGAFIAMAIILFIAFRRSFPVGVMVLCVILDALGALGLMAIFRVPLSLASIAGLLMIIGYSVDTDILLSNHMLKRYGEDIRKRISNAMRTGLMTSGTTLITLVAIEVLTTAPLLYQLSSVLIFGVLVDVVNTWFMNAGMLLWYTERRRRREYYVSE